MADNEKETLRAPFFWFGGKGPMLAKLSPLIPAAALDNLISAQTAAIEEMRAEMDALRKAIDRACN